MLKDSHGQRGRRLPVILATGLALLGIAGCATGGGSAPSPAASESTKPAASAKGLLARGGTTASNRYVDPALVSAASAGSVAETAPADQPAYPQIDEPSMAGAVMQPTGIRAGSVSIFSAPASAGTEPAATGTVPAVAPAGRVDATAGSVFSTPAPAPGNAEGCETAGTGTPVSC